MYVEFDELADRARVWIYQANIQLTENETTELQMGAQKFATSWATHGVGLKASAKVFHNQFLVLAVDESDQHASGCSIDSSVAFVKQAEKQFNLNFFDRSKVAVQNGEEVTLEPLNQLKNKIAEGKIQNDTITFNNLVATKGEMKEKWLAPAQDTWLARYF